MMPQSIAPSYVTFLRDWDFRVVALFDNWRSLNYVKNLNGIGTNSFSMGSRDPRVDLFKLDYFVDVHRAVPGCGISRHSEFIGFHRKGVYSVDSGGDQIFVSSGMSLEEILKGAIINFPEATIRSYKFCSSNRAILEYVRENCGDLATVAEERYSNGVVPNFEIDPVTEYGPTWEGDRAFENLLDVLVERSKFSGIDFSVEFDEASSKLKFHTYTGGLGKNRTYTDVNPLTGNNSYGEFPFTFSLEKGTISSISYEDDHSSEANVVSVLGDGDASTRHVQVRESPNKDLSPYNRREVSRPQGGFENEMQVFGDGILEELKYKQNITIKPLMSPSSMYHSNFGLGDWISIYFKSQIFNRRIVSVTNSVDSYENISLTLALS